MTACRHLPRTVVPTMDGCTVPHKASFQQTKVFPHNVRHLTQGCQEKDTHQRLALVVSYQIPCVPTEVGSSATQHTY